VVWRIIPKEEDDFVLLLEEKGKDAGAHPFRRERERRSSLIYFRRRQRVESCEQAEGDFTFPEKIKKTSSPHPLNMGKRKGSWFHPAPGKRGGLSSLPGKRERGLLFQLPSRGT